MLKNVRKALRIKTSDDKEKIALVFDGPTLLPDFKLDYLKSLKEALTEIGSTRTGKFITDRQFSQEESQVLNDYGFQEEIVGSDVDMHVSLSALEYLYSNSIDIIGIATTDPNLFPIMDRIRKEKKLLIIIWKDAITPAIETIADFILELDFFV